MAPREGFEPPRPMDSGFRIHRNTGLCDLGSNPPTSESEIRMTGFHRPMQVEVRSAEGVTTVESDVPISVGGILDKLGIAHSTVLAVVGDTIIPHTSMISDDVSIELVVVSSGG